MTAAAVLPEPLLKACSEFLARRIGLYFPPPRWPEMQRALARVAPAFGFRDAESCARGIAQFELSRAQVEILAGELTVGETYFFRDPAVFAALENEILPPLIAARRPAGRRLRLWSAGCCTGEEAYSLAIAVTRLLPDLADWKVSILGSDINARFLAKAKCGVYREWSFRAAPPWLKTGCFEAAGPGVWAIAPRFKRLVSFDYLNLAEDVYPSIDNETNGIDVIFCRNVLMYFEPSVAEAVVRKLHRSLVEGGWLIASAAETSSTLFRRFATVQYPGAIVYRKAGGADLPRVDAPCSSPALPSFLKAAPEPPTGTTAEPIATLAVESPTASPEAPPPRPATLTRYEAALAAYRGGDYANALVLLAGATDDPRALALLARAAANQGRLEDAGRWCEAAVEADKFDPGLRYLFASVLEEQGFAEAALSALKQALYLDQDYVLAHFALGNLYRRLDKPASARRHLATARQLLRRQPPDAALPDADGLTAGRLGEIIDATEGLV